jgi:hypothetical protein
MALAKPQPITRRRIYDTVAGLGALAVIWGVVTVEDVNNLLDAAQQFYPALGVVFGILARRNVDIPAVDEESFIEGFPEENTDDNV